MKTKMITIIFQQNDWAAAASSKFTELIWQSLMNLATLLQLSLYEPCRSCISKLTRHQRSRRTCNNSTLLQSDMTWLSSFRCTPVTINQPVMCACSDNLKYIPICREQFTNTKLIYFQTFEHKTWINTVSKVNTILTKQLWNIR